jgi:hypothetical protein
MATVFKVVLRSGKTLSVSDFPDGTVVAVKPTEDGIVHVSMRGRRADAEEILFGLKGLICFFQQIESAQKAV